MPEIAQVRCEVCGAEWDPRVRLLGTKGCPNSLDHPVVHQLTARLATQRYDAMNVVLETIRSLLDDIPKQSPGGVPTQARLEAARTRLLLRLGEKLRYPVKRQVPHPTHKWIQTSDPMTPACSECKVRQGDPMEYEVCPKAAKEIEALLKTLA